MTDPLKPNDKEWHRRQDRHRHNSFFGHVGMTKSNMNAISRSSTTTPKAKSLASIIRELAFLLGDELKTRIDK
jgi:hypothetical protein